jgi:hypothetical protein
MNEEQSVKWLSEDGVPMKLEQLVPLLEHAWAGYAQQTNWHHKHLDNIALRTAALIAGELTVMGLALNAPVTSAGLVFCCATLLVFSVAAVLLVAYGLGSAKVSFERSMDYVITLDKVLWAMGYGEPIHLMGGGKMGNWNPKNSPAPDDECIFCPDLIRSWSAGCRSHEAYKAVRKFREGEGLIPELTSKKFSLYHSYCKAKGVAQQTRMFTWVLGVAATSVGIAGAGCCIWMLIK